MQRINYTSASYETIVVEVPRDVETDPSRPRIIICRRDGDGFLSLRRTTIGMCRAIPSMRQDSES